MKNKIKKMLQKENIKKIWLTDEAIFIETDEGKTSSEMFENYSSLKNATKIQRENFILNPFGIYWEDIDEDLSFDGFFKTEKKSSDIGKVFSQFQEINISSFARRMGISQPLMAAYLNGDKKPGKNRKKEIENELHNFGRELMKINL